jgi:hypothetical protein
MLTLRVQVDIGSDEEDDEDSVYLVYLIKVDTEFKLKGGIDYEREEHFKA